MSADNVVPAGCENSGPPVQRPPLHHQQQDAAGATDGDCAPSSSPKCFVIVYNVSKKHNIGTLLRNCTAFGVTQVRACDGSAISAKSAEWHAEGISGARAILLLHSAHKLQHVPPMHDH